jgi:thiamine-phosphate pyrophosphorylase
VTVISTWWSDGSLALRLVDIVQGAGGLLSIGGDVELAAEVGAGGVHARDVADMMQARQALGPSALVGVSAHGMADVTNARLAGADYVTLSPIYETASKPGYGPALGIEAVRLAAEANIAIVGLGGMSTDNAAPCGTQARCALPSWASVMRARNAAEIVRVMLSSLW